MLNANFPRLAALVMAIAFLATQGCNSKPAPSQHSKAIPSQANAGAQGPDLQCVANRIHDAPEPFHYSYIKDSGSGGHWEWQGDVTHDSIDGTLTGSDGAQKINAKRTDGHGWDMAASQMAMGLPASTFALFNHSSAIAPAGAESVNGYSTTKYKVDSAMATDAEATLLQRTFGPGGYVKGSVWVINDGCIVKFTIDALDTNNGSTQKEHYEEAIVKQ